MRRTSATGFTLVELMIVVSIIALLVAMVAPTLGQVRALTLKAVCSGQLKAYGSTIKTYVTTHGTYPRLGGDTIPGWGAPGVSDVPYTKIYAVMELSKITTGGRMIKGLRYYDQALPDDVWEKALCPAMDPGPIWDQAALTVPNVPQCKPYYCTPAVGYQWNVTLRGRERAKPAMPEGRYPAHPIYVGKTRHDTAAYWANNWITWYVQLKDGGLYAVQAITPEEIENPSTCAEAWDGMDINSVPKQAYWGSGPSDWNACDYGENLVPGWPVGPQTLGTNGWALLPADRHPGGSPNILYADGTVRADATRRITEADIPAVVSRFGADKEMHLISWDDYEPQLYGTIQHLLPGHKIVPPPW